MTTFRRLLAGLGAGFLLLFTANQALAATTGLVTISAGQISASLSITANTPFSISQPGNPALPVGNPISGINTGTNCFTVVRSQDSGVTFSPLINANGSLAHYCGPITVDEIELRSGTYYAVQADPGAAPFTIRIDE